VTSVPTREDLNVDAKELWKYALVVVIAVAAILHTVFPRYEWRTANGDGTAIVIYDRWGGTFQRAGWDDKGEVKPTQPFKP
jgi:hypothetical protein